MHLNTGTLTKPGNRQAREATWPFLTWHSLNAAILYFEQCVLYYARVVHRVLSASCAVSMHRRILNCGCISSRSPIVVVQFQTAGNMWNWRKRASTKFRCQEPDSVTNCECKSISLLASNQTALLDMRKWTIRMFSLRKERTTFCMMVWWGYYYLFHLTWRPVLYGIQPFEK